MGSPLNKWVYGGNAQRCLPCVDDLKLAFKMLPPPWRNDSTQIVSKWNPIRTHRGNVCFFRECVICSIYDPHIRHFPPKPVRYELKFQRTLTLMLYLLSRCLKWVEMLEAYRKEPLKCLAIKVFPVNAIKVIPRVCCSLCYKILWFYRCNTNISQNIISYIVFFLILENMDKFGQWSIERYS